ncbi:TetR family transcriptional regulator [Paenibacillus marchantiophytorum]|uniref:TetR family transcriptional regulator n=1 Tax=Paenibacillus marchantiophytorum TaxID=1619310 RepID=A0ABQ1ENB0_9BACL|nr:TetR/AcrR family transcriptional regulator [Paenibacillus marchantiophytorum]GFZ79745.1 TetR family transcriptional regulator [Paenibacillus marchantiophytorum]
MKPTSTYEDILNTGYRLFAEHGFEKTSMTMIAKEVKISKPALYYHFVSKEAMIDVLFDEICKSIGFTSFFHIPNYTATNFKERLISDGLNIIAQQKEDENYSRIMHQYQALGFRNMKYSQKLIEVLDGFTSGFAGLLQHGAAIGVIHDTDVLVKAQLLNMIISSIDNFISYGIDCNYEDIWTKAVHTIVMRVEAT